MGDIIKILILEDVPLDSELMEAELRRDGIDLFPIVWKKRRFRRELMVFEPDVILADHSLPDFDGISAMYMAQNLSPQTPFIFVVDRWGKNLRWKCLKKELLIMS
jgi:DNA-binding response OmpR family regulator